MNFTPLSSLSFNLAYKAKATSSPTLQILQHASWIPFISGGQVSIASLIKTLYQDLSKDLWRVPASNGAREFVAQLGTRQKPSLQKMQKSFLVIQLAVVLPAQRQQCLSSEMGRSSPYWTLTANTSTPSIVLIKNGWKRQQKQCPTHFQPIESLPKVIDFQGHNLQRYNMT